MQCNTIQNAIRKCYGWFFIEIRLKGCTKNLKINFVLGIKRNIIHNNGRSKALLNILYKYIYTLFKMILKSNGLLSSHCCTCTLLWLSCSFSVKWNESLKVGKMPYFIKQITKRYEYTFIWAFCQKTMKWTEM